MGCCVSSPADNAYPTQSQAQGPHSSSRAINGNASQSNAALPRPSTTASSYSNRLPGQPSRPSARISQPLTRHINRPLKLHTWQSNDRIWIRHELDRERDAFFDTRVTGRPEVWQSIKLALEVLWQGGPTQEADARLATTQAILDSAGITIPTGNLARGVYDQSGIHYPLPEIIVSDPTNMAINPPRQAHEDENDEDAVNASDEAAERRVAKGKGKEENLVELTIRFNKNGGMDYMVTVDKEESLRQVCRKIMVVTGHTEPQYLKILYRGKILKYHKSLEDEGWQDGDLVLAVVCGDP